jgi:hypothetical protein
VEIRVNSSTHTGVGLENDVISVRHSFLHEIGRNVMSFYGVLRL